MVGWRPHRAKSPLTHTGYPTVGRVSLPPAGPEAPRLQWQNAPVERPILSVAAMH